MGLNPLRRLLPLLPFVAALLVGLPAGAQGVNQLHQNIVFGPEGDWVDPVELPLTLEAVEEDQEPVTYLLMEAQVRLPKRGPRTTYLRSAYRINSRSALEDWASHEIEFEPSYQHVVVHHVMIQRDSAWVDRIEQSRWSLLRRESDLSRHIFDQRLTALVLFDDVRVGDVISVAYSVSGENPVFDGRYSDAFGLGWSTAVERRRLRILSHVDRALEYKVHGAEAEPARERSGEWNEIRWDLADLPAYEYLLDAPYDWVVFPWIQLSEWGDWGQVVDWAAPLYEGAIERSPELSTIAAELRSAAPGVADTVIAARNWVQDEVRYLAIVLNKHSHAPHGTNEILSRRYGDCKDKTVLFISLLRELGLVAYPSLVNTERLDAIGDWLPSPHAFDHVIVAVGEGEDRIWLDPTLTFQGGDADDFYVPPYGLSLVVEDGASTLASIPDSITDPGLTRATYRYDIHESSRESTVDILTEYEGRQAEIMRSQLATTTPDELLESYVNYYTLPSVTVSSREPLEISDSRLDNALAIAEKYDVLQEHDVDSGVLFQTLAMLMENVLPFPANDRTAPLALRYPYRSEEVLEVSASSVALAPVDESMETPWFRFAAESRFVEDTLRIDYDLETRVDRVGVDEIEDYRDAVEELYESVGYSITNETGNAELRNYAVKMLLWCAVAMFATAAVAYATRRWS